MTQTATRALPDPGASGPFRESMAAYEQASQRHHDASLAAIEDREAVAIAREMVKDVEAVVTANGGVGEAEIKGSNKEARDAELRVALAGYPAYRDAVAAVRKAERTLAETEADRDDAANDMRGARLRVEYATSFNLRMAAVESRMAGERNGHA